MSSARVFPDCVPVLTDPDRAVRLRAHAPSDLPAIVELARDPETIGYTTIGAPYDLDSARSFLSDVVGPGWAGGDFRAWAIEAPLDETPAFRGSIDLRLAGDGSAEVGFGLHPRARGRGVMSAALRLVRDHAFDTLGLAVLRWRAVVGNWGSRKVAASAGFRFDGRVRQLLHHRGEFFDGWIATLTAADPRLPLHWLEPPPLPAARFALRPFEETDLDRIVEACNDARTRHWLVSLPAPYDRARAEEFLAGTRELAAGGQGLTWCLADPEDGRCLGSVGLDGLGGYSGRAEIGYWSHPAARGRGLMTDAVRLVTEYAAQAGLAELIQIRCAAGNRASRHVASAAGYAVVGRLPRAEPVGDGSREDLVLYARAL